MIIKCAKSASVLVNEFGKGWLKKANKQLRQSEVFVVSLTLFWCLVGFVEDLHEVFGHEVRLLQRSIVTLQVLHCEINNHNSTS